MHQAALSQQNTMRLLFSTPQGVYVYDVSRREAWPVHTDWPEYYGITATTDGLVFSHSRINNADLHSHEDCLQAPLGHVASHGTRTWTGDRVLLQPHQIEAIGDTIVCANSGRNCLTLIKSGEPARHHFPVRAQWDLLPDGRKANHFNSVHHRDSVLYCVAHNYDRPSTVWLFSWPELELLDVLATAAHWAHNAFFVSDELLVCDSRGAGLYSVTRQESLWHWEQGPAFTRGAALAEERLFVGLSAVAGRQDRRVCDSSIVVLNAQDLTTIEVVQFSGIGGIHEIRVLDQEDLCHGGGVIRLPASWDASPSAEPVVARVL